MQRLFRRGSREVTVVSGLPRSGTSMMMQILDAGGVDILTDDVRVPDESNPRGYYEFEPVKRLGSSDNQWLREAQGRAVKVISPLLPGLPDTYRYRVIFMLRDLEEILDSQQIMIEITIKDRQFDREALRAASLQHLTTVQEWLKGQAHIETLYINHRQIIEQPAPLLQQIAVFLRRDLNIEAMQAVIDPKLYRKKGSSTDVKDH